MLFRICENNERILYQRNVVQLKLADREDNGFRVAFDATFFDHMGRRYSLGLLRIGMKGMTSSAVKDYLPMEFSKVTDSFFSLGQSALYYERINRLRSDVRQDILASMRDVAYRPEILQDNRNEAVLQDALLCDLPGDKEEAIYIVKGQLHRMAAHGGARLTEFSFSYTTPEQDNILVPQVEMSFDVVPESHPPTNIHALIGRNGCGKTYMMQNMLRCLRSDEEKYGKFSHEGQKAGFANALYIALSPFDDYRNLPEDNGIFPITKLILNKGSSSLRTGIWKSFWEHFENCLVAELKMRLWQNIADILKSSDSAFEQAEIDTFMDEIYDYLETGLETKKKKIRAAFNRLSSGHKVVLLIITSCVAEIDERSILFLDEPENHLHPPLLSALIRALSALMTIRNGVAVIATHSPVVLQEVPDSCVWILRRNGAIVNADRPDMRTFGANIGSLTNDVFGFEVTHSGFHNLIRESVVQLGKYNPDAPQTLTREDEYQNVAKRFNNQLGDEADLLLRTLLVLRRKGVEI